MKAILLLAAAMIGITVLTPKDFNKDESPRRTITLTGMNTVLLVGDIDPVMTDNTIAALVGKRSMLPAKQTMYVLIASPGGMYQAGVILNNFISTLPNTEVICRACYSAAGMIFSASKLKRLATDNSSVLMHEMYTNHVTANVVRDGRSLKDLVKQSDEFNKLMYTVLGMSKSDYEDKIRGTEWIVEGEELVSLHLADEMVNVSCDMHMMFLAPETCAN